MDQIVNRFLKYVSFDTQSDEASSSTPSTLKQFKLAEYLVEELNQIGMQEVEMDSMGYVYATLPANVDYDVPTIGFIAHMDTSPTRRERKCARASSKTTTERTLCSMPQRES